MAIKDSFLNKFVTLSNYRLDINSLVDIHKDIYKNSHSRTLIMLFFTRLAIEIQKVIRIIKNQVI